MNKKIDIDPMVEARKGKYFDKYYREAKKRIKLSVRAFNHIERLKLPYKEVAEIVEISEDIITKHQNAELDVNIELLEQIIRKIENYKARQYRLNKKLKQ